MIRGILFDKDGTLIDFDAIWVPVVSAAFEVMLTEWGLPLSLKEEMMEAIGVKNGITSVTGELCCGTYASISEKTVAFLASHGVTVSVEENLRASRERIHSMLGKGRVVPVCDDLGSVLEELKKMGITLGVVTSDDRVGAEHCLEKIGILSCFDVICADDGIHPPKPDPYYLLRFLEEKHLKKEEVMMVGDTFSDIRFAKNAGVFAVGVAKNEENRLLLAKEADVVLPDVSFLPALLRNGEDFNEKKVII